MARIDDQGYLLTQQYRDGTHLETRGAFFEQFGTNPYHIHHWLFDHLRVPNPGRLLELGCGTGGFWLKNLTRLPPGWDLTLSDLSAGMVQAAQAALQALPHPVTFAVIDAQHLPYPEDSYDAVLACWMLYHVPDRTRAMREVRRVLRPGGRFYALTGSAADLRELDDFRPARADDWGRVMPFTLENGADQLAVCFEHIDVHRYENTVVITEAAPLVAHLLSKYVAVPLTDDERTALTDRVHVALAAQGVIRTRRTGALFEAY